MDGVEEKFQEKSRELRLQKSPQLQRHNEEACQQDSSRENYLKMYDLAGAQLKEGKISQALWTVQMAEIHLKSCGPRAPDQRGWVPGMSFPWEVLTSPREAAPGLAQKVDAEPTLEDLRMPRLHVATFLKELKEQHQALQKVDAEPTREDLLTPKMDLFTALAELKEQLRAVEKLER